MSRELIWGAVAVALLLAGLRVVRDHHRLLIFRLGRPHRVAGPGICWIIPLVDRALRVNLDRAAPDWRSLSERDLIEKLVEFVSRPGPLT